MYPDLEFRLKIFVDFIFFGRKRDESGLFSDFLISLNRSLVMPKYTSCPNFVTINF